MIHHSDFKKNDQKSSKKWKKGIKIKKKKKQIYKMNKKNNTMK